MKVTDNRVYRAQAERRGAGASAWGVMARALGPARIDHKFRGESAAEPTPYFIDV